MNLFSFDITLGNVLQIAAFLSVGYAFVASLKGRVDLLTQALTALDRRINSLESAVTSLNSSTIDLARQEVRLDSHARRIVELETELKNKLNEKR